MARERGLEHNRFISAEDKRHNVCIAVIGQDEDVLGQSARILQNVKVLAIENQIGDFAQFDSTLFSQLTFFGRIPGKVHWENYHNQ